MRILHPQFRDENAVSRYPFTDDATLVSQDNRTLDPRLIIDALLYPVGNQVGLYLQAVNVDGLVLTFIVANNAGRAVCSGSLSLAEEIDPTLLLLDDLGRPAGVFIVDPDLVASLQQWSTGRTTFGRGATLFVPSVVAPSPEIGARGLGAPDGLALTDDIWLVGEDGVFLTKTENNEVRVDIVGDPLFRRRLCVDSPVFEERRFVRTINGIPPTYWGGFTMQAGRVDSMKPALRIYAENGSVVFAIAGP